MLEHPAELHPICCSEDLIDGRLGQRFEINAGATPGRGMPAFVVRSKGVARAFFNRCAHVPVELDWQLGQFFDTNGEYLVCATHGAQYDPQNGRCINGPCVGQSLQPIPIVEQNGWVYWKLEKCEIK